MIRITLISLFVAISTSLYAQTNTVYHASYDSGNDSWWEGKGKNDQAKAENGVYKLSHFREESRTIT